MRLSVLLVLLLQSRPLYGLAVGDDEVRHFRSLYSDVYVIKNFLPLELAQQWQSKLQEAWDNTTEYVMNKSSSQQQQQRQQQQNQEDVCSQDSSCTTTTTTTTTTTADDSSLSSTLKSSVFFYATNNDGETANLNAKVRSLESIDRRRHIAHYMRNSNYFSYAKWELFPSHALVKEMESTFCSRDIRNKVQDVLGSNDVMLSDQLSDFFVTMYAHGDFLSPHNDGHAGTWAFIVSLVNNNNKSTWNGDIHGGTLEFQCPSDDPKEQYNQNQKWCETVTPSFNSAVLIQTRLRDDPGRSGPFHHVLPVKQQAMVDGLRRFSLTGWYMDERDVMTEQSKKERDLMRARE